MSLDISTLPETHDFGDFPTTKRAFCKALGVSFAALSLAPLADILPKDSSLRSAIEELSTKANNIYKQGQRDYYERLQQRIGLADRSAFKQNFDGAGTEEVVNPQDVEVQPPHATVKSKNQFNA